MRVKPKKQLGQNFLFDKNIQKKIVDALELKPTDTVLEIGAGYGQITRLIAGKADSVYAVEVDKRLSEILKEEFKGYPNIKLLCEDILGLDLGKILPKKGAKVKVFGNIPYYITTPIITRLFGYRQNLEAIFIMVQKEFARRICAVPGSKDYGAFSCFVQYYGQPKIIFFIKKGAFRPSPKVDSAFIKVNVLRRPPVKLNNEGLFFKVIRASFNQRRKILKNSLQEIIAPRELEVFFSRYHINPNIRPESLSLQDFAKLANLLEKT